MCSKLFEDLHIHQDVGGAVELRQIVCPLRGSQLLVHVMNLCIFGNEMTVFEFGVLEFGVPS